MYWTHPFILAHVAILWSGTIRLPVQVHQLPYIYIPLSFTLQFLVSRICYFLPLFYLRVFLFNDRHIYCELCSRTSPFWQKLLAGLVSFTFIYLWHGYYMFLFAWVLLNSVLLCMEQLQRKLFDKYRATLQRSIGDQNIQRLNAIIGSQLVLPSIITNLMFIGGPDIGLYLAERTYLTDGLLNYILLSFVAYNFYQYSSSVCAREQRSQRSQHREHTNWCRNIWSHSRWLLN